MPPKRRRRGAMRRTPRAGRGQKRRRTGFIKGTGTTFAARRRNIRTAGFLGIETKYHDTSLVARTMTAPTNATGGEADPATLNTLFAPTQGTGAQNRDGRKVLIKSLQLKGTLEIPVAVNQTLLNRTAVVFMAVVWDKQTNAAQLNSEDVFENQANDARVATSLLRGVERGSRFQILKTWTIDMPQVVATYDGTNMEKSGVHVSFETFLKLNIPVEYVANGGTIADVQDNSLHLIAFASNVDQGILLTYNCRTRFVG